MAKVAVTLASPEIVNVVFAAEVLEKLPPLPLQPANE